MTKKESAQLMNSLAALMEASRKAARTSPDEMSKEEHGAMRDAVLTVNGMLEGRTGTKQEAMNIARLHALVGIYPAH